MKKTNFFSKAAAFLLSALMLLGTVPVAYAVNEGKCATCGTVCTQIVLKQANCHEQGVVEYICVNSKCSDYKESVLIKTDVDPTNHDTICTDNGDGATHTANCRYHADYKNIQENHVYVNGYCTKCASADYSQAVIVMESEAELYIDLNDTSAALTVGKVAVMVGNVDITQNYVISYSWVDGTGRVVGTAENLQLGAAAVSTEGDYSYGCFVMAMPKNGSSGKTITGSCTVLVHVRDLITAEIAVGSKDSYYQLDQTNGSASISVAQQIYQAVYQSSAHYPSHVVFDTKPVSDVGDLLVGSESYYFTAAVGQNKLSDVRFIPARDEAGTYSIRFTAYDTKGYSYPGLLTIVVERDLGSLDVAYFGGKNENVIFSSAGFAAYWQGLYPGGELKAICFKELPPITQGILYYNYNPASAINTVVKTDDLFFTVLSSPSQYLIDGVTFVPAGKFTGHVTIPFDIYGLRYDGFYVQDTGELSIFVSSGEVAQIEYSLKAEEKLTLPANDLLALYRTATGSTGSDFSIKLLDVPEHGLLYAEYTGTIRDVPLTAANVSDLTFYYSSDLGREIGDITYVAPKSDKELTDTIRYLVCDGKGEFVYIGTMVFTTKKAVTVYTVTFTDVKQGDWFYTYVMDMAQEGIINGFEEKINGITVTSYKPQENVTYGQALKLIMLAAGYDEQAPTGKHWASGYLTLALQDKLISAVLTEARLDEEISRNMIAYIAGRAMKLPESTRTESPFKDVVMSGVHTPYILALYDAGIITGDDNGMYNGSAKITRAEMATIIWRIRNYEG